MFQANVFRVLYSIYSLIIGILIFIFSILIYTGFSSDKSIYLQTLQDWEQNPIVDIYVLNDITVNCQPGEDSVFQYNWPGTKEGCLCTLTNQIREGQCCTEQNKSDCCEGKPINPVKNETLDIWDINGNKFKLCAIRLDNYSFRNNAPQSLNCLASEKWCGKDSQGNQDQNYGFCVPANQKCAVQEILIGQVNPNPQLYDQTNIYNNSDGSGFWVFIGRGGPLKLPLINFKVSSSEQICTSDDETIGINQGYQLNKMISSCSSDDYLYEKTSISINQQDFLNSNNLSQQLSALPNYQYSSDELYLFSKSYPSLKMKCRGSIETFYDNLDVISQIEQLALPNFITCCVYSSILLFFDSWIGFKYNKFSWGVIIFKEKVNNLLRGIYILKYILFLSCNFLIIFEATYQIQINNFLSDIVNKQCTDSNQNFFNFLQNGQIRDYTVGILLCAWMHFLAEPNVFFVINKFCCSQIQDFMRQSTVSQQAKNTNNQTVSKDVSISMDKHEEKPLPQNNSISFYPPYKSPSKKPSSFIGGLKKTVSYKLEHNQ
ncbi:transmembrane protein, putative (macronuclear) [Tetrahymena thermophila SB210]|uniref:Transmembrane protein, putative n=1 Tax=Tetrahymena thermophila (strain SB210) TaxID=312017 RepID=I7MGT2_TETTS|nr:transmembrane protein, putative [Tetrahymena thermophila SB210]EAS02015.2 transmembrane protein, putative [Tetrahymena thermophila SB210]|eukprot:XP_001022260.2 transmembrane protein, putative [Tetrahymena thermophila SB210]